MFLCPLGPRASPISPVLAILGLFWGYTPGEAREAGTAGVTVVGTEFRVTGANGAVIPQADLVGVVLTIADQHGKPTSIRIDGVERDERDPSGEVTLYDLAVMDVAGGWRPLCTSGPDGRARGFPLSGVWTPDGRHLPSDAFDIACTSGVIAKCVRAGYKPWRSHNGVPLWDYHQACVRMFRADYCGDGVATTREGTLINFEDKLGLQVYDHEPGLDFEAAWGADGAVCVRKVRIPENTSLETLVTTCPTRLAGRSGETCMEESARVVPQTLITSHSRSFGSEQR